MNICYQLLFSKLGVVCLRFVAKCKSSLFCFRCTFCNPHGCRSESRFFVRDSLVSAIFVCVVRSLFIRLLFVVRSSFGSVRLVRSLIRCSFTGRWSLAVNGRRNCRDVVGLVRGPCS